MINPFAPLVPGGKLQTLFAPEPFDLLVAHAPAFGTKQLADPAVAVAAVWLGQPGERKAPFILVER